MQKEQTRAGKKQRGVKIVKTAALLIVRINKFFIYLIYGRLALINV